MQCPSSRGITHTLILYLLPNCLQSRPLMREFESGDDRRGRSRGADDNHDDDVSVLPDACVYSFNMMGVFYTIQVHGIRQVVSTAVCSGLLDITDCRWVSRRPFSFQQPLIRWSRAFPVSHRPVVMTHKHSLRVRVNHDLCKYHPFATIFPLD